MNERTSRLAGQGAIVTGAGRGIGRVLALTLADEGAGVVLSGRNEPNLRAVEEEIRSAGGEAMVIRCDVTRRDQVQNLVKNTVERHGTIDILVNNAAIHSSTAPLVKVEEAEWEAVMETNVKGVFLMTQAVLPVMMDRKSGHIIIISSGAGTPQSRNSVNIPYVVSKWAVEGFRHSMAIQLKPYGIRVNNIAPGPTLNDLQKSHNTSVERLMTFPGGMRRNEWVADSFRYLVCESEDLTGGHISSPEWEREHGITRDPISEEEIRAFMAG
ncbi:MAG: SDR family NAD(P)-dependent oxidoreductase [Nitrospinota bacterium]